MASVCKKYQQIVYFKSTFINSYLKKFGLDSFLKNEQYFRRYTRLCSYYSNHWIIPNFKYFIQAFRIINRTYVVTIDSSNSTILVDTEVGLCSFYHKVLCPKDSINYTLWLIPNPHFDTYLESGQLNKDYFAFIELEKEYMNLHIREICNTDYIVFNFKIYKSKTVSHPYCNRDLIFKSLSKQSVIDMKKVFGINQWSLMSLKSI